MKEIWTREEVIQLLIQALHDSPSMVSLFPDGSVKDIKREGMFGFDAFVIKHIFSKFEVTPVANCDSNDEL